MGVRMLFKLVGLLCAITFGACGSSNSTVSDGGDASTDTDGALPSTDGTPVRSSCQSSFGSALGTGYGRLDGILTAIVPPSHHGCSADSDHLHLQVKAHGALYDIAITATDNGASVYFAERDRPLPGPAWAEGWQSGVTLDYVQLGLHAADFVPVPETTLVANITAELAEANHVSVYSTAYPDHSGAHLVHRNGAGEDGALVLRPTDGTSHLLMFHFATQSF